MNQPRGSLRNKRRLMQRSIRMRSPRPMAPVRVKHGVWTKRPLEGRASVGFKSGGGVRDAVEPKGRHGLPFRVVAENEAGVAFGEDRVFTTVVSAPVNATFVTGVSASEATLHAGIDPLGHDTYYHFDYGRGSCRANRSGCTVWRSAR